MAPHRHDSTFAVMPKSDALEKVEQARDAWLNGGSMDALSKTASSWSTQEWVHFIDSLPRKLSAEKLARWIGNSN